MAEPPLLDVGDVAHAGHPLVVAVARRVDATEFLRAVQHELARKLAELEYVYLHPAGIDLLERGRAISREVRMLKRIGEVTVAERRALGPTPLPLDHPLARQVIALLIDKILSVAREVLPADAATLLEHRIRDDLAAAKDVPWP